MGPLSAQLVHLRMIGINTLAALMQTPICFIATVTILFQFNKRSEFALVVQFADFV